MLEKKLHCYAFRQKIPIQNVHIECKSKPRCLYLLFRVNKVTKVIKEARKLFVLLRAQKCLVIAINKKRRKKWNDNVPSNYPFKQLLNHTESGDNFN